MYIKLLLIIVETIQTFSSYSIYPTVLQVIAKVQLALATAIPLVIPDFATGQMQFHFYAVARLQSFELPAIPSIPIAPHPDPPVTVSTKSTQ